MSDFYDDDDDDDDEGEGAKETTIIRRLRACAYVRVCYEVWLCRAVVTSLAQSSHVVTKT